MDNISTLKFKVKVIAFDIPLKYMQLKSKMGMLLVVIWKQSSHFAPSAFI